MQQQRTRLLRAFMEEERRKLADARMAFTAEVCGDEGEIASFQENINVVTIFMQRAQQRLRHLECSVAALEHQTNTVCQDCGEELSPARLAARPDAVRCTLCQEEWEEEQLRALPLPKGSVAQYWEG